MVIKSLAGVTLVPTPVTFHYLNDERVEEQLQAHLLAEIDGQVVTYVGSSAMTAEPFVRIGRFVRATIWPRAAGGNSQWELDLVCREKRKRTLAAYCSDFPANPVILMLGEHPLDFAQRIGRVPFEGTDFHRFRDESYAALWALVSSYCAEIAGPRGMLIDTTDEAIRFQSEWLLQWRLVGAAAH